MTTNQPFSAPQDSYGGGTITVGKSAESSSGETPVAPTPADEATGRQVVPKWETTARERVKSAVRKFHKPLVDLVARDANEGDTRLLVTDFLCEGLGYDKYRDLTTEYQVKGDFADYGIRIDRQLMGFIEVKRCATKLGQKHLRQAQTYAVNEGVEWIVLTNGQVWEVYHLTGGLPVVTDIALRVDLLDESSLAEKANLLFYLSLEAMKRGRLDDLWKVRRATSGPSLAEALRSPQVLEAIRKEVRKRSGHNPTIEDIRTALDTDVIRQGL